MRPRRAAPSRARAASAALVAVLAAAALPAAAEEDELGSKSSDILEVLAWCRGVEDLLDWGQVLRLSKTECRLETEDDDVLRTRCSPQGLAAVVDGALLLVEHAAEHKFGCANGIVFILSIALAYQRDALAEKAPRAQVLLWQALQENFMLDASPWPVKTFDVLQLFDHLPPALSFEPVPALSLEALTLVVPRCPALLASSIMDRFPGARVIAGLPDDFLSAPKGWTRVEGAWGRPSGVVLNEMLAAAETPLVLVVLGAALPEGLPQLESPARALRDRRLVAAAGPVLSEEGVYMDFCYRLQLRHYAVSFDAVYQHSVIFDEGSASSIRGSWFHEDQDGAGRRDDQWPCKLCETLPPTFLGLTDAVRSVGFQPTLDGEWALLDFALRAARAPLVGAAGGGAASGATQPGRRHAGAAFASCPAAVVREVASLGGPHLYGRGDAPRGVSPSAPLFGGDAASLGPVLGGGEAEPLDQAQLFMNIHHLREFTGPEGVTRHFGCGLDGPNCPVPDWVYRGWAAPPCCRETMRHLLFYIDDVFRELGVRYIVTDGALLGSLKFGSLMLWDSDVDLHIYDEDFDRLEAEVQYRVERDGHFLRKHTNNNSWLLQANEANYLLIELNRRLEAWDPEKVWQVPIQGRLFPAMEDAHVNLSSWYGYSFFRHRLRHVPEWEEENRPMFCSTPYHHNCVDELQVPSGVDCQRVGVC
ncbi:unnamed protein product [Prorocentrum cordatum]|uniref:Uncharacterized protein n=1 Tax=Prorocentrum cordatum TaxID=2364126 RepID=A0ABN9UM04_9DINO|nr:unnamed protein product [Polarella glacialis]